MIDLIKREKTVSAINTLFQIDNFQSKVVPLYVVTDFKQEKILESFGAVVNNKKLFIKKLNEGLEQIKK